MSRARQSLKKRCAALQRELRASSDPAESDRIAAALSGLLTRRRGMRGATVTRTSVGVYVVALPEPTP